MHKWNCDFTYYLLEAIQITTGNGKFANFALEATEERWEFKFVGANNTTI